MVGAETIRIAGSRHVRESLNGTSYLVSPAAFFQTNTAAAEVLQRLVVESLGGVPVFWIFIAGAVSSPWRWRERRDRLES